MIILQCVPHVQHAYFWSFDQPNSYSVLWLCRSIVAVDDVIYQTRGRVFHQISKH